MVVGGVATDRAGEMRIDYERAPARCKSGAEDAGRCRGECPALALGGQLSACSSKSVLGQAELN